MLLGLMSTSMTERDQHSMILNVLRTLPKHLYVAFSGGVDSCVLAHLAQSKGIEVTLLHYHHGNALADLELSFTEAYARQVGLPLIVERCTQPVQGSREKFWRDSRYAFFKSVGGTVAVGANLDDAVEWYLLTSLRGRGEFMPYSHANVVRPLLLVEKAKILAYAAHHGLQWFEDPNNADADFTARNKIRHEILPKCLEVNPGLYSTVKKKIFDREFGPDSHQ